MVSGRVEAGQAPTLLAVRGVSKTFGAVRALDDVSLSVAAGEVVALVGQNGSGKSTLIKILSGFHEADPGGEVRIRDPDGVMRVDTSDEDRLHFIHQDLGLIEMLSTIENLELVRGTGRRGYLPVKDRAERQHATAVIERFGTSFDVTLPVARLTAAERAIVAIARALDGWTRPDSVLVLDEPTAALNGQEVGKLLTAVRRLAAEGAGIIFVSHRLDEVIELADRVVVLRDGRVVADAAGDLEHDELARLIAGREVARSDGHAPATGGGEVLRVRELSGERLRRLDFAVRAGEIVGVAGQLGSGREEVAGMVFGSEPCLGGEIVVEGRALEPGSPHRSIERGLAYVPADRALRGAIMPMNVRENLTLPRLDPLRRPGGRLDGRRERREAARWIGEVELRPDDPECPMPQLSGGNQQKVVLAKWLRTEPKVLLLDEPTQGVDVGARAAIYGLVRRAADAGAGVLLCSSEMKELASNCDRVLVLVDGQLAVEIARAELTEARLVRASLGGA
jgi:ribose transport system ATP-binding protein